MLLCVIAILLERDVQPALKSLRKDGINIVAINHHMTGEERATYFSITGAAVAFSSSRKPQKP